MKQRLLVILSHGFGIGLLPIAPGTVGSVLGIPLVWGIQSFAPTWGCAALAIPLFLVGVPICLAGQKHFQRPDPGSVVFDEIAAFLWVFALTPLTWQTAIAGFLAFRILDIAKPGPIRRLEALPGGWGVMADDAAAGIISGVLLWLFGVGLPMIAK